MRSDWQTSSDFCVGQHLPPRGAPEASSLTAALPDSRNIPKSVVFVEMVLGVCITRSSWSYWVKFVQRILKPWCWWLSEWKNALVSSYERHILANAIGGWLLLGRHSVLILKNMRRTAFKAKIVSVIKISCLFPCSVLRLWHQVLGR